MVLAVLMASIRFFFMDPVKQQPVPIIDGMHHPYKLVWSSDSKWLAVIGEHGVFKTRGLWIYSVEGEKIYPVTSGDFHAITWSPDDNKIAATICEPNHPNILCDRYEVWEYDVSSIK